MKNRHILAVFLVFVAFCAGWKGCGDNDNPASHIGLTIPSRFPVQITSKGGVKIQSTVPVPVAAQQLVDSGIQTQIDRTLSARPAWTAWRSLSAYEVFFIDPMGISTQIPGAPLLIVDGGITCSGTNLGTGGNTYPRKVIVLPHQQAQGWRFTDYLENSARYESEHIALWMNDRNEFWLYTGANDQHPIFP